MTISASMLYDLAQCPHRVSMDLYADPSGRDPVSAFSQLLWDSGNLHEETVIAGLTEAFTNLSAYHGEEKAALTYEAFERGDNLIYSGRICFEDLVGEPDLLRREGNGYIAGDIKSGAGEEGTFESGDSKLKKTYAVQLALYTDILEKLGRSSGRKAYIIDAEETEVAYDFAADAAAEKPQHLWETYEKYLDQARTIVSRTQHTLPAYSSTCKKCLWYTTCVKELERTNDLTLIPDLGRARRDAMIGKIPTIQELSTVDIEQFIKGKKTAFAKVGSDWLRKFQRRAILLSTKDAKPYLVHPVEFPAAARELFFDIEVDPMRSICYLHGFIERVNSDNSTERFMPVFADEPTEAGEERAFRTAVKYIQAAQPCAMYYYSAYERTIYRKLQKKYPHVCSEAEVEALFDPDWSIDLCSIVKKSTEWPTRDFSIKTLAKFLGFEWKDANPSGAASIEWFDNWVTGRDPKVRERILVYNEDDCRATRILLDGLRQLEVGPE